MKCPKCSHTFSVKKGKKTQYLEFVFLTDNEYKKLLKKFGKQGTQDRIKNLDDQIAIHGYKYKDHYRVILKWAEKEPVKPVSVINQPPVKPKRVRRKDTPEEKALLIKMKELGSQKINWRNREEVRAMTSEIKKLQKKYDDLRNAPQKVGDILKSG